MKNESLCMIVFKYQPDDDVAKMIHCKSHQPINTIIKLFVKFTRSADKILTLLQPTPSSSSMISNPILRSPTKLYYGGLLRRANITNSLYGYGIYFRSNAIVTMSISHNFTFDELQHKITQIIGCGTHFVITHIDYLRPVRIVDKKLIHGMVEIETDNDVAQIIKR